MKDVAFFNFGSNSDFSQQEAQVTANGHTAIELANLSNSELARADTLYLVTNGAESLSAAQLGRLATAVENGMDLVLFDEDASGTELLHDQVIRSPITLTFERLFIAEEMFASFANGGSAPLGPGFALNFDFTADRIFVPFGSNRVVTLVEGRQPFFRGIDEMSIQYKLGEGTVHYAVFPISEFWDGSDAAFTQDLAASYVGGALAGLDREDALPLLVEGSDAENDILVGDFADDTLRGFGGDDLLFGSSGDDLLDGGNGDNDLVGGPGADTFLGSDGSNTIEGGRGKDFAEISGTGRMRFDGGDGNDTALGGGGSDVMDGGAGDDVLHGGASGDHVVGDHGADRLFGDQGRDTLVGDEGKDTLKGGRGNDLLDGGDSADLVLGGKGNDVLVGRMDGRVDTLDGGDGVDVVSISSGDNSFLPIVINLADPSQNQNFTQEDVWISIEGVSGTFRDDTLIGDDRDNILSGGLSGRNVITGGAGNDTLIGGFGVDILDGGSGDDELIPGRANDTVTGGDGADTFVMERRVDQVVITDFEVGIDTLDLHGQHAPGLSPEEIIAERSSVDGDTLILTLERATIILEGVLETATAENLIPDITF